MTNSMTDNTLDSMSDEALLSALLSLEDSSDPPRLAEPSAQSGTLPSGDGLLLLDVLVEEAGGDSSPSHGLTDLGPSGYHSSVTPRVSSDSSSDDRSAGSKHSAGSKRRAADSDEAAEAKRQNRMARNRASAAASRQRKQARAAELEAQVAFLVRQNEQLCRQVGDLRQRTGDLQSENARLAAQLAQTQDRLSPQQSDDQTLQASQKGQLEPYEPAVLNPYDGSLQLDSSTTLQLSLLLAWAFLVHMLAVRTSSLPASDLAAAIVPTTIDSINTQSRSTGPPLSCHLVLGARPIPTEA